MSYSDQSGRDALSVFRARIHRRIATRELEAPVISPDGTRPVIIVDERERVSKVLFQADRTGGFANLFVLMDDGREVAARLLPIDSALMDAESEKNPDSAHMDSEIGMLLRAASTHGDVFEISLPSQTGAVSNARDLEPA